MRFFEQNQAFTHFFSTKKSFFFIFCLFSKYFTLYLRRILHIITTIILNLKSNIMNKTELIEKIAAGAGLTKVDAKKALDATVVAIKDALVAGDKVALVGFGTFAVNQKPAREGVNPATKQKITIAAKKVAKFKAGAELAEAVNK
jgi:DNA-binding protein HU-beta